MKSALKRLAIISLLTPSILFANPSLTQQQAIAKAALSKPNPADFDSAEHQAIGDNVLLKFSPDGKDPGVKASTVPLTLADGLHLTYGQIIALSGDFFADPKQPISSCAPAKQTQCFLTDYATLANKNNVLTQQDYPGPLVVTSKLTAIFTKTMDQINAAIKAGQQPSSVFAKISSQLNGEYNMATGGGTLIPPYIPFGFYITAVTTNIDHFEPQAFTVYNIGHRIALAQAIAAHKLLSVSATQANSALQKAYAENAYANHFLTDAFAAGHTRTPRVKILDHASDLPPILTILMTNFMHNEDNKYGLNVVNQLGQHWLEYGDGRYFDNVNDSARPHIQKAAQTSADEIYHAFVTGVMPTSDAVANLVPCFTGMSKTCDSELSKIKNFSPMFKVVNTDGKIDVARRTDLSNRNDFTWTTKWDGLATFAYLELCYPDKCKSH